MINFIEDNSINYANRTFKNVANSDYTFIFAKDINTPGEKCTINACLKNKKHYISIILDNNLILDNTFLLKIINYLNTDINFKNTKILNIAGNGIYTLNKYGITQEQLDKFIYDILYQLKKNFNFDSICSGGQTGVDEAGLKAGNKLNLKCTCLAPLHWKFRNILNIDISNEKEFKKRFNF